MTDVNSGAPAPKKRSFFKRAAWQDAEKKEDEDIFSHSSEFKAVVAEQARRREEEKRKQEDVKQRKQPEHRESKRRRLSNEAAAPILAKSESSSSARAAKTTRKARSRTPLSPGPSQTPPDSLAARYDSLAKSASSNASANRKEPVIIDLDDEEDNDADYNSQVFNHNAVDDYAPWQANIRQDIAVRSARGPVVEIEDDVDEDDPTLAAFQARARERAALRAQSAATPAAAADGEPTRVPIAQLFINPEIPGANPLVVKVRLNSTMEKPRQAWCQKQGYAPEVIRNVFFTWKGTRIYDSTTVKRLGMLVDKHGNVSVEGDSNIYDDVNLPKVTVNAWTEELFQQRKKEDAAEAAAKKLAAEAPPVVEVRTPTPEPTPQAIRVRLILKAKGKPDFRLSVKPETDFAHIASAYKASLKIDEAQPITLTFDGERLSPLDTIADSDIEDLDSLEVLYR